MQRPEILSENDIKSVPGCDIIVYGYISVTECRRQILEKHDIAERYWGSVYCDRMTGLFSRYEEAQNTCEKEILSSIKSESPEIAVWKCGSDGIYGALWHMTAASRVGIRVNARDIEIPQECIEICNMFDINPYRCDSSGCLLITVPCGLRVMEHINEITGGNVPASMVGYTLKGNEKLILNGEEIQYLTRPEGAL